MHQPAPDAFKSSCSESAVLDLLLTKPSLRTLTQRLCLQKGLRRHMRPWLPFPTTASFLVRHLSATNIEKEWRIRHQNTAHPESKLPTMLHQSHSTNPHFRHGSLKGIRSNSKAGTYILLGSFRGVRGTYGMKNLWFSTNIEKEWRIRHKNTAKPQN